MVTQGQYEAEEREHGQHSQCFPQCFEIRSERDRLEIQVVNYQREIVRLNETLDIYRDAYRKVKAEAR